MTKELHLASDLYDLGYEDVRSVLLDGFKSAFLNYHDRAILIQKALEEIDELIEKDKAKNAS